MKWVMVFVVCMLKCSCLWMIVVVLCGSGIGRCSEWEWEVRWGCGVVLECVFWLLVREF